MRYLGWVPQPIEFLLELLNTLLSGIAISAPLKDGSGPIT
jgi:hypothetical protein